VPVAENIELARRAYAAFNAGDRDAAFSVLDPEIEFWQAGELPGAGGTYHGHAGIDQVLADLDSAFDDLRFDLEDIRGEGDWLLAYVRISGRGKGSGVPFEVPAAHVFWLRDGLAVRWEGHFHRDAAHAAVGL
jgi:ketosteroid isomerase-like protein